MEELKNSSFYTKINDVLFADYFGIIVNVSLIREDTLMKKSIRNFARTFALLAVLFGFASCAKKNANVLYLYNWTYYTPEDVVADFAKENGTEVKLSGFSYETFISL